MHRNVSALFTPYGNTEQSVDRYLDGHQCSDSQGYISRMSVLILKHTLQKRVVVTTSCRLLRWGRQVRRVADDIALGKLLLEPEVVVLLGPIEIDLASPHSFERALHSDSTNIDVAKNEGDEQEATIL